MNLNEFLRGVSLFSMLPDEDLKKISERAAEIKYVRDAFICKEAEKADSMFIIKSGIVQIFCDDGKGGRKILTHLKLGDYFGKMALLTDEPRTASAIALAETEVLRIRKDDFQGLVRGLPDVAFGIIRTLCDRLAKANVGTSTEKKVNVYTVMGPDGSSGKSLLARNLAMAMQNHLQKPVLLFDPNVRDDRLARMLGVEQHSRIIDELVERERIGNIQNYVIKAPCGLMTILPQENGFTDLRLKEFHTFSLMKTIFENFEFVVVDSSSMFTKVTKEIVTTADKIVYLISSKNVSVESLIAHFEETRRGWRVDPSRVVYGVNHNVADATQEGHITPKARETLAFELPYEAKLAGNREPDKQVLLQRDPQHAHSKVTTSLADDILFDQQISLFLPAFPNDATKAELARRWVESAKSEMVGHLNAMTVCEGVEKDGKPCAQVSGRAPKWSLNQHVVAVVDFANRYKQEFALEKLMISINGQESVI